MKNKYGRMEGRKNDETQLEQKKGGLESRENVSKEDWKEFRRMQYSQNERMVEWLEEEWNKVRMKGWQNGSQEEWKNIRMKRRQNSRKEEWENFRMKRRQNRRKEEWKKVE